MRNIIKKNNDLVSAKTKSELITPKCRKLIYRISNVSNRDLMLLINKLDIKLYIISIKMSRLSNNKYF